MLQDLGCKSNCPNHLQYYRFFSGDYAKNKSKHILNTGLLMQAFENGDLMLLNGQAARQSVDSILGELDDLKHYVTANLNEEINSNE